MSAALTPADIDAAIGAFTEAGRELGVIWHESAGQGRPRAGPRRCEDGRCPRSGPTMCWSRSRKTGICGTDIHIYKWDEWAQKTVPVPMIIGHEYAGEIVAVGRDVTHLKVGQRVSGEGQSSA